MQKELPSRTSPPAVAPGATDYLESMRPFVPPEALEIVRINNLSWQAYIHRQNTGRAANRQSIRIPNSVEESRTLSFVHLASIAQSLSDSEKATLTADLKAQGIKSADLI